MSTEMLCWFLCIWRLYISWMFWVFWPKCTITALIFSFSSIQVSDFWNGPSYSVENEHFLHLNVTRVTRGRSNRSSPSGRSRRTSFSCPWFWKVNGSISCQNFFFGLFSFLLCFYFILITSKNFEMIGKVWSRFTVAKFLW